MHNRYFEEYLQVLLLLNFAGNIQRSKFSLFIRPEISMLLRKSLTQPSDNYYTFSTDPYG